MSEIAKTQSFEERMKERVKENIGDLITDEELSKIVHKNMEDIFFKPRIKKNTFGSVISEEPPLLHELLQKELETAVQEEVKKYMKDHKDEVLEMVHSAMQEGLGECFIRATKQMFQNEMYTHTMNIENRLQRI